MSDKTERWGFYTCILNGVASSVLVDLALQPTLPDRSRPWMLVARVRMRFPNSNGLSSLEEGPAFDNWSEQLIDTVCRSVDARYVGRVTGGKLWEFFFYSPREAELMEFINESLAGWEGYQYTYGCDRDSSWSFYKDTLLPRHPKERHQILTYAVIQELYASGDSARSARPISHFLLLPDTKRWEGFQRKVAHLGLSTQQVLHDAQDGGSQLYCEIQRTETVNLSRMNSVVAELIDLVSSFDGEYQGWESRVESSEL